MFLFALFQNNPDSFSDPDSFSSNMHKQLRELQDHISRVEHSFFVSFDPTPSADSKVNVFEEDDDDDEDEGSAEEEVSTPSGSKYSRSRLNSGTRSKK